MFIQYDAIAITDQIYEHLVFDGRKHIPIATLPGMAERTITICGLGKTFQKLGRGLVRFAFPKKDETLDEVERRFEKLK